LALSVAANSRHYCRVSNPQDSSTSLPPSLVPGQATGQALIAVAAVVVIVAGIRSASPIFVPFLLAGFISLLCAPALFWLQERGLPTAIALLVVLLGLFGIGAALGSLLGTSINEFTRSLPAYQARFATVVDQVTATMSNFGVDLGDATSEANPFNPKATLGLVGNLAGNLGSLLNNAFLLFLTVCFILLEASSFPHKVREAFGHSPEVDDRMTEIGESIRRYLGIKTLTSMLTGFLAYAILIVLGVKFAPLWALVAFLLNFVPAIGSVLAAVPAVALALVDNSGQVAMLVAAGYIGINISIGSFLEPRVMGEGMGLSPLVVLLSLIFWGWVLGPVGMVLAVPLTVILRIMLLTQPHMVWIAVLLGPAIPKSARTKDDDAAEAVA
jgi:AI-2 transport protein TqsA